MIVKSIDGSIEKDLPIEVTIVELEDV